MVIIGSARHDENFRYSDGRAGDQIGSEVETQEWYPHPKGWRVLRCRDSVKAEKIAANMQYACDNPCIGYDQNENYSLWDVVKHLGFDCRLVDTNCETDCARLVRVCCAYAGIMSEDFFTGNEAHYLLETGEFDEIPLAANNPDLLRRGDILVTKTKGHTVIVVQQTKPTVLDEDYVGWDYVYIKVYGGEIKMAETYKVETVRMGSKGPHVLLVQEILLARGYRGADNKALKLDGEAGDNTMFAIAHYIDQRNKQPGVDLGSNDAWGPKCWADQALPKA